LGKFIDLTGQRFGRLVVVERGERPENFSKKDTAVYWNCLCDCGKYKTCKSSKLKSGAIKSCGNRFCKYTDLTGKIFGRLLVIKAGSDGKWECECSCGKRVTISAGHLNSGSRTSCGCKNRFDLVGKRFGRLLVESLDVNRVYKSKNTGRHWSCRCDCGKIVSVMTSSLMRGSTLSCGCYNSDASSKRFSKPFGVASFNVLFKSYKYNAEKREKSFCISSDRFYELTKQDCYYCGQEPKNKIKASHYNEKHGDYIYNGIDRIDSSKGYEEGNVVPCCGTCNIMKMALPQQEFLDHIERIHNYQKEKNNGN
jgi:hypothetical protein